MDFIGGALPNVMFLVGIIAIGIGLGMEFKIVEVKGDLSRSGRIGAFGVGALLIALSVVLYTRPPSTATNDPAPVQAGVTGALDAAPPTVAAPIEAQPTVAAPIEAQPTVAAPIEAQPTVAAPTKAQPTVAAPTEELVRVPELRDRPLREAETILTAVGLKLGERVSSCDDLGLSGDAVRQVKKDRVACQSVQPGERIAEGSSIDVVVGDDKAKPGPGPAGDDDDDD